MLSLSRRSAIIAAVLLSGTVASMLSSIVSADDATYSIRMEFCQNWNVSNSLSYPKGATIPSSLCVRYTNLSDTSLSITSELVDAYLMADGRLACRENDEPKTGFAKTARFKVGNSSVENVNVTVAPNASVEAYVSPGFTSASSSVYGCVVTYADSVGGAGINVITRRAITASFIGGTVSGSNIVDQPAAYTNTGTTSTGTTNTGTTNTGTTATGTTVTNTAKTNTGSSTASGSTKSPTPAVTETPTPSSTVSTTKDASGASKTDTAADPEDTLSLQSAPEAEKSIVTLPDGKQIDSRLLEIIKSDPTLTEQLRGASSRNASLSSVIAVVASSGGGGSSSSTSSSSITTSSDATPCGSYSDLGGHDEFCGYVRILSTKQVIREDTSFEPSRPITRAELLKIAMLSSKLTPVYNPAYGYDDVSPEDWWAPYVSTAKKYGYISQTNKEFRPNDTVTRAETIKILMSVTGHAGSYNPAYGYDDVSPEDWWAPYVSTAKKYGYISQTNKEFRPNDTVTRAESSKIVVMTSADRLLFE